MNFLIPFVKFKIIFSFILISAIFGNNNNFQEIYQGTPIIRPVELNGVIDSSPNHSIVTDEYRVIDSGQENKIVINNGSKWKYIYEKGEILICRNASNIIYFSGNNHIGFLTSDSTGKISPIYINEKLPQKYQKFTRIFEINSIGNTVFYHIDNALIAYKNDEFIILNESFSDMKIFNGNGKLICASPAGILSTYSEDLKFETYFPGILDISLVIPFKDGYYIFDKNNYLLKTDLLFNIHSKTLTSLKNPVNQGIFLKNGEFIVADIYNSIFIIDSEGLPEIEISPPFYKSRFAYISYGLILLIILFILYKSYKLNQHRTQAIFIKTEEDHKASKVEEIALAGPEKKDNSNFYPEIDSGKVKLSPRWDKYEMATVLFSDIQGFTKIAESMNPEDLIDELDKFFFHFDAVVEKYNIEKIKTIGDAYMAAGGIPQKNISNPIEVVLAALEMQQFMKQLKNTKLDIWDLRIGIHSGPVIAGTIGQKKRSYDIWGDTVNTASRMESSGEGGKVNISGVTYNLVKDYFICEYRGKLPVKYKGNIDMYFVKGLRPELSINLAEIPNRKFFLKLQRLRIRDLESEVFLKLEAELPKNYLFHNIEYLRHQYEYAELLSRAEQMDAEDSIVIITSALLMNVGYTSVYENHENKSAEYARMILPKFKYTETQITNISNLILSSKYPPETQSILEKLLYDIRMEFFGRTDFISLYKQLFLEQKEFIKTLNFDDFKNQQLKILEQLNYFTTTARRLREVTKEEQIKRIIEDKWI